MISFRVSVFLDRTVMIALRLQLGLLCPLDGVCYHCVVIPVRVVLKPERMFVIVVLARLQLQ